MSVDTEQGIVYIATGEQFVEEARLSAESVKSVMSDVSITLFTDEKTGATEFDQIIEIDDPRHDFGDQVYYLNETPYERTIFLDSDIYLDASIEGLFTVLNEFDIAAAHNQINYSSERTELEAVEAIPDCFPEYNSGVVAFKSGPVIDDFFEIWQDVYAEVVDRGQIHNQAAFRLALYRSDVRIATVPSEYNCVFRRPGCVNGQVKVFHGRLSEVNSPGAGKSVDVQQAVDVLNSKQELRAYYRFDDKVQLSGPSLFRQVSRSMRTHGILGTIKQVPGFLKRVVGQ